MTAEPAEFFRSMADRIDRNKPEEFSGALLVVPPGADKPIEILLINPAQDLAAFWATVSSTIQVAAAEFQQKMQNPDPWARR